MMIFSITAIDEHRQTRYFTYGLNDLGADLDFIHELVAEGHSLVSVQLVDQHRVSYLPVETFNAALASRTLDQLESEWKAILKGPPASSPPKNEKISRWVEEWVSYIEGEIIRNELTITEIYAALQVSVNLDEAKPLGPQTYTAIDRYNSILKKYNRQLIKLYAIRYRLLNKQDAIALPE